MSYYLKHSTENKYFSFSEHTVDSVFILCLEDYLANPKCQFNEKERSLAQKWQTLFTQLFTQKGKYTYKKTVGHLGEVDSFNYILFTSTGFNINNNDTSCRLNEAQIKEYKDSLPSLIEYAKATEQLKKIIKSYFPNSYIYQSFESSFLDLDNPFSKATFKEILYLNNNFNPIEVSFSADFLSKNAYVSYVKEEYENGEEGFFSRKNSYGNVILSNISQAKLYDSVEILNREIGYLKGAILEVHVEVKKVVTNPNNYPNLEKAVSILEKEKLEKVLESYNDDEIQATFEKVQKKRNKI